MTELFAVIGTIFVVSLLATLWMYERKSVSLMKHETSANKWLVWHIKHPVPVRNVDMAIRTMEMYYNKRRM
jgi:hypothetical protein